MGGLPAGTVTYLFTDIAGSTRLWEDHPREAGPALARHDALIEGLVAAHAGQVVRPRGEGDSRFAVFARATDAVAAAAAILREDVLQRRFAVAVDEGRPVPLPVRLPEP